MTGVNKIICSDMKINFLEGKLNNISFFVKPDAKFLPPKDLKEDDMKLKGFIWRNADRPTRESVTGKQPYLPPPPVRKKED
jgi:hypothetical protein